MSYLTEALLSDIKNEFSDISFEYREIDFGGTIPSFFIKIENEEKLTTKWKAITEFIAIHFQSSLRNEFSLWNIYLFFILENEIRDDLKYTIENDTFSSRKIIIIPSEDIDSIINEHIKNNNIDIQSIIAIEEPVFEANPLISKILNEFSYKKKISDDIKNGLDQIIETIKSKEL
jgi:hypothetical protein